MVEMEQYVMQRRKARKNSLEDRIGTLFSGMDKIIAVLTKQAENQKETLDKIRKLEKTIERIFENRTAESLHPPPLEPYEVELGYPSAATEEVQTLHPASADSDWLEASATHSTFHGKRMKRQIV